MLRPRITPCLLLRNGGLVKTRQFGDEKYVGDPINAVKIFNEKSVDEIIVIDIDATRLGLEPNYRLIERLANESRMPLCYGGGIKNLQQAEKIIQLGVEKVAISSAFIARPELIGELSEVLGSQSVVAVLDVKKSIFNRHSIFTHNGTQKISGALDDWIQILQKNGVGEIMFNSINNDGMLVGYDMLLVDRVSDLLCVPSTFLGGASSLKDIGRLIEKRGVGGCAAGSMFVFKGKYRAVLINYPRFKEKQDLIVESLNRHKVRSN